ncbi:MAG: heme-binding protein [Paracoccaceae bacterium]|nr:heme-binding protein [Paracoccaceae bacterium]
MAAGSAIVLPAAAAADYRGYETPKWRVLKADGVFELRDYDPYLAAEVSIRAAPDRALRQGFRTLAGYIFGGNDTGAKVAMTAPVTRAPAGDAAWTVRFMMPGERREDTLPRPDNRAIRLVEIEPGLRAVVRFSGLATEARIAAAEARLRNWLAAEGLTVRGPAEAAWFDDPFTLPWRRRNEVSLPVAMS